MSACGSRCATRVVTLVFGRVPCRQLSGTVVALNKELEQVMAQTSVAIRADEEKVAELSLDIASDQRSISQLKEQVRAGIPQLRGGVGWWVGRDELPH
jgi:hypothetical protein